MDFWTDAVKKLEDRMSTLVQLNIVQYKGLNIYILQKYVDDIMAALDRGA